MKQKEIDHIRKREMWRKVMVDHHKSGLPISTYCREKGISASSYWYWRKVIMQSMMDDAVALGVLNVPDITLESRGIVAAAVEAMTSKREVQEEHSEVASEVMKTEESVTAIEKLGGVEAPEPSEKTTAVDGSGFYFDYHNGRVYLNSNATHGEILVAAQLIKELKG